MKLLDVNNVLRSAYFVLLGSLFLLLSACIKSPQEPLRLGTNVWLGYEPLYLARKLGDLKPDTVRLVEYVSATQVMRGLIDGTIDAGALTLDEAILLRQQGLDVQIILVMDYSAGADALVAHAGIKNLKALKGKRVGVETTALGAYMMQRALEKGGLRLNEVKIVPLELSQHEQAYLDGKIDAVVTFDPVRSRLLAQGANSLLDSSQLPGEVVDVLVVRNDVLAQQQSNIVSLLKTWFKTLAYIKAKPLLAARGMTARQKLEEADVLKALEGIELPDYSKNRSLLGHQPVALKTQADRLVNVMLQNNLLAGSVHAGDLFDIDLLQELYP